MKIKYLKCLSIISYTTALALLLVACSPSLQGLSDNKERPLNKLIIGIKEGIIPAKERTLEWGSFAKLYTITAGFNGKEQIESRKGNLLYFFTSIKDSKLKVPADAFINIDMNKNSITQFCVSYDPRGKKRAISELEKNAIKEIDADKWKIDINQAFDIALNEIGKERVFKYDTPKVVLRCFQSFWEFDVYPNTNAQWGDVLVIINPETGQITQINDKHKGK